MDAAQLTSITDAVALATDNAVAIGVAIIIVSASVYAIRVARRMLGG